jgi:hypothetical protein
MNQVVALFAAEIDNGEYDLELYAVADSFETAETIAEKDFEDGVIHSGWACRAYKFDTKETI